MASRSASASGHSNRRLLVVASLAVALSWGGQLRASIQEQAAAIALDKDAPRPTGATFGTY